MERLVLVHMILALVCSAITMALFRAKPPTVRARSPTAPAMAGRVRQWRRPDRRGPARAEHAHRHPHPARQPPSWTVIDGPEQVAGYTYGRAFKETFRSRSFLLIAVTFSIGYGYDLRTAPRKGGVGGRRTCTRPTRSSRAR